MAAPSSSSNSLDVVLNLIMKETGLTQGVNAANEALDTLNKKINDSQKELESQNKILSDLRKSWVDVAKEMEDIPIDDPRYKALSKNLSDINDKIEKQAGLVEKLAQEDKKLLEAGKKLALEQERERQRGIALLQKEGAALNALASARAKELDQLRKRADLLGRGSTGLFATGIAGFTAITALAKKYVDTTDDSNAITKEWAENSEKIRDAQERIGKVAAETVLPLFTKLAEITGRAASFVEAHPEVLEAGLKASIVAAGLGGIGILVSKGIRLYADVKMIAVGELQLTAAKIMSDAANKQLLASKGGIGSIASGGGAAAGGGISLATGGAIVGGAVAATAAQGFLAAQLNTLELELTKRFGNIGQNVINVLTVALTPILPLLAPLRGLEKQFPSIKKFIDGLTDTGDAADKTNQSVDKLNQSLGETPSNLEAVANIAKQREDIIQKSAAEESRILRDGMRASREIAARAGAERRKLTEQYNLDSQKAEETYQNDRAGIISSSAKNIQKIERDHRKELLNLARDHNQRVDDLTRSRDALGLVKEQRQYEEQQKEADDRAKEAIEGEKRETRDRLRELDIRYRAERREREQQYRQQLRDIGTQAAAEIRANREHYMEELRVQREAKAQQLRELQQSLEAETNLKRSYYSQMQNVSTSGMYGTAGNPNFNPKITYNPYDVRSRAAGGYASYGMYMLGDSPGGGRGPSEYVIRGSTARALESMIGGRISDQALLQAQTNNRSLQYNDFRRINGGRSYDRRESRRDTIAVMTDIFEKADKGKI